MVFSTQSKVGHGVWIWGNMLHEHDVEKGILEDIIIIDGRPSEDHGRSQDMINVTTGGMKDQDNMATVEGPRLPLIRTP